MSEMFKFKFLPLLYSVPISWLLKFYNTRLKKSNDFHKFIDFSYKKSMENSKKFHFLGVGGVSMSALARFLVQKGHKVSGVDIKKNLRIRGVCTSKRQALKKLKNADFVVVSNAIKATDKDLNFAKTLNKTILSRGELLAEIAKMHKCVIAVSGTHGKTTTTEMLAEVFTMAGLNPTVHIGGVSNFFNDNLRVGGGEYFITEACEYHDSFLCLNPDISIVLNVEEEHLDYFKTFENEKKSFEKFMAKSKVVVCHKSLEKTSAITFGDGGVFDAKDIKRCEQKICFCVQKNGKGFCKITLNSFNQKNVLNALAVTTVCDKLGIDKKTLKKAFANFKGVKRRSQVLSKSPLVIHDYAHHPTEIENMIMSARDFFQKPVWVVFEPHTYSRTKDLFQDFVRVLALADKIFLLPTYSAREEVVGGGRAEDIFNALKAQNKDAKFFESYALAKKEILNHLRGETLLVLGAGSIDKFWGVKV